MTTDQNQTTHHDMDPENLPSALRVEVRDAGDTWVSAADFGDYAKNLPSTLLVAVATSVNEYATDRLDRGHPMDETVEAVAGVLAEVLQGLTGAVLEGLPSDVRDAFLSEALRHAAGGDDDE